MKVEQNAGGLSGAHHFMPLTVSDMQQAIAQAESVVSDSTPSFTRNKGYGLFAPLGAALLVTFLWIVTMIL